MKKYLYIIPLTPSKFLTPLREKLFEVCIKSLKAQQHDNWEAWMIGEEDKVDGPLTYIASAQVSKKDKLLFALDKLRNESSPPEYIIRFDDDDVVHPQGLAHIDTLPPFDCYRDAWHAQFDIVSGRVRQNRVPWLPNAAVHSFPHVFEQMVYRDTDLPILVGDHAFWKHYYKDKNVLESKQDAPFYVRIFSPSSHSVFNMEKKDYSAQYDIEAYTRYLGAPSSWIMRPLDGYSPYFNELLDFWESYTGQPIDRSPKLIDTIRQVKRYLSHALK